MAPSAARAQRDAHIFAPAFALLVGEGRAHRQRDQRLRQRAGKPQQQRPHHAHEGDEDRDRIARQADEGGAARRAFAPRITPIATGRPGLIATRQNTSRPIASTAPRT